MLLPSQLAARLTDGELDEVNNTTELISYDAFYSGDSLYLHVQKLLFSCGRG